MLKLNKYVGLALVATSILAGCSDMDSYEEDSNLGPDIMTDGGDGNDINAQ